MMVVVGTAADVGVAAFAEQGADGAALPEELDRPVGGRQPEPWLEPARPLVQIGDGEAAGRAADRLENSSSLVGCAHTVGKDEVHAGDSR